MTQKHTVMLIIMDGFGCRDEKKDNAVAQQGNIANVVCSHNGCVLPSI